MWRGKLTFYHHEFELEVINGERKPGIENGDDIVAIDVNLFQGYPYKEQRKLVGGGDGGGEGRKTPSGISLI